MILGILSNVTLVGEELGAWPFLNHLYDIHSPLSRRHRERRRPCHDARVVWLKRTTAALSNNPKAHGMKPFPLKPTNKLHWIFGIYIYKWNMCIYIYYIYIFMEYIEHLQMILDILYVCTCKSRDILPPIIMEVENRTRENEFSFQNGHLPHP